MQTIPSPHRVWLIAADSPHFFIRQSPFACQKCPTADPFVSRTTPKSITNGGEPCFGFPQEDATHLSEFVFAQVAARVLQT